MGKVLVTGGLGYIGSHTCIELIHRGYRPIIVDNLLNSEIDTLEHICQITGYKPRLYNCDICDKEIFSVFEQEDISFLIHFAALKSVKKSFVAPLEYYKTNVAGTINLLEAMGQNNVDNFIFSSSAAVYGGAEPPFKEESFTDPVSPSGRTKLYGEKLLFDWCKEVEERAVGILRYFNPMGAHSSRLIGERIAQDGEGSLMQSLLNISLGKTKKIYINGDDYDTADGTCVRDYVHVVDLAKGHADLMDNMLEQKGFRLYNLGAGRGHSVFEVIKTFEEVSGLTLNKEVLPRRQGDIAISFADVSKAERELSWKAARSLKEMCQTALDFALNQ